MSNEQGSNGSQGWQRVLIGILMGVLASVGAGYWPLVNKIAVLGERIASIEAKIDILVTGKK